jgi:hypothetical protein
MHTERNTISARTGIRNARYRDLPAFQFLSSLVFPGVIDMLTQKEKIKPMGERGRRSMFSE